MIAPVEETKGKEFYMEKDVIKTREVVDMVSVKESSLSVENIPVYFTCWECLPSHTHFFRDNVDDWNFICTSCGKRFHKLVDITDYKEVVDGISR